MLAGADYQPKEPVMVDTKHLLGVLLGTGCGGRNPMAGQALFTAWGQS
jgi:hypothetical protein